MKKILLPLLLASGVLCAQAPLAFNANDAAASGAPQPATDTSAPDTTHEGPVGRWLAIDKLDFSMRYRNSASASGGRNFDSGQARNLFSGKFKFDDQGKYSIGFRASSGRYFNWAYSNFSGAHFGDTFFAPNRSLNQSPIYFGNIVRYLDSGPGLPEPRGWEIYMRELYFSASPIKALTFQFGGLGIEQGAGSEATNFDDDGYIVGERVKIKDKSHLYFDEVSATFAYFGDIDNPSFFLRGARLNDNNYRQLMVQKKLGKRASTSFAYDWIAGVNTMREAARVAVPESRVLDGVRVELYQRVNSITLLDYAFPSGKGWSLAADKNLWKKRWHVEAGYADVDRFNGVYTGDVKSVLAGFSLNGDSYQIGKRIFAKVSYTPTAAFTMFTFFTHEVDTPTDALYNAFNHQSWQAGATLNFKALLDKTGLF